MAKKFFFAGVVVALVMALAIPAVLAATNQANPSLPADVQSLYQQMWNTHSQLIQKQVEAGNLSPDQAKLLNERFQNMQQYITENGLRPGQGFGPGMMAGFGNGSAAGFGPGAAGCPFLNVPGGNAPVPPAK